MRMGVIRTQAFETAWIRQYVTPLLYQGGQATRYVSLLGNTDTEHLLGFGSGWHTAQRGQSSGNSVRILYLANPVLLAQPIKRFDLIGTDRHSDGIKAQRCSGNQMPVEIGEESAT